MQLFFSPDSKFTQIIARFCDIVVLNVLYVLTCLPLFTVGAANAALYTVVFRMDTDREERLFSTYFRAFRENFRQATGIWLILVLFAAASCVNMVRFSDLGGTLGYFLFLFAMLILLMVALTMSYVFPLLSQFRSTGRDSLKNALLLCVAHLPRSIIVAIINIFPWTLLLLNLYTFMQLLFVWAFMYFAAAAYFNSRILKPVFDSLAEKNRNS